MNKSALCIKWSPQEDKKFIQAVKKFGNQWKLVQKEIKYTRSINSIVKRWHVKLKFTPEGQAIMQQWQKNGIPKNQPEEKEQIQEESQQSQDQSDDENYQWQRQWTQADDKHLRTLIVRDEVLDWKQLAQFFSKTNDEQIKNRWKIVVYPEIKEGSKIGGALKWSLEEDAILMGGVKSGKNWKTINQFLPVRSEYSIEARWRRISRHSQAKKTIELNKHLLRKQVMIRIANKYKTKKVQSTEANSAGQMIAQ